MIPDQELTHIDSLASRASTFPDGPVKDTDVEHTMRTVVNYVIIYGVDEAIDMLNALIRGIRNDIDGWSLRHDAFLNMYGLKKDLYA